MSEYVFRYPDGRGWKPGAYERENSFDHYGTLHEEIVRCRDCSHFRENAMYGDSHTWCEEAPHFGRLVPPDGYCHRGVRREA